MLSKVNSPPPASTRLLAIHTAHQTFSLPTRSYAQQFSDIYFLRLSRLKPAVEKAARRVWSGYEIGGEKVRRVERVLDVRQGELCWVTGTVYMDMPLKPNVLEDIAKDHWIAVPISPPKYTTSVHQTSIHLEDESGRIRLTGTRILTEMLVTGCVIGVMGSENADGDFAVLDICLPGLSPQPKPPLSPPAPGEASKRKGKIAIISGLKISGDEHELLQTHLLTEWLLGELLDDDGEAETSRITHLLLAGNTLSSSAPLSHSHHHHPDSSTGNTPLPTRTSTATNKRYGYDSSTYNPHPLTHLDSLLSTLLPSIPIVILPGPTDPANPSLPQQPIHHTMLPRSAHFIATNQLITATNPYLADIDGVRILGTAGQNVHDIYKYIPPGLDNGTTNNNSHSNEGDDSSALVMDMAERTLRWRHVAPTCPDTLAGYPFHAEDPFVIRECPGLYFLGNCAKFETRLVRGERKQVCRMVAVPEFRETGEVVLVDLETLGVEVVRLGVEGGLVGSG